MTTPAPTQTPTIGRIIHYWIVNAEECERTPNPAVITRVYFNSTVDLHVLGDIPRERLAHATEAPDPMRRGVPWGATGTAGTWCWPPRF